MFFLPYSKSFMVKLVQSEWLEICIFLYCGLMDVHRVSGNKHAKNKMFPISDCRDLVLGQH